MDIVLAVCAAVLCLALCVASWEYCVLSSCFCAVYSLCCVLVCEWTLCWLSVQLFHVGTDDKRTERADLELVGVVCYYGKHYSTFFFHSKRKTWISFDDACVSEVIQYILCGVIHIVDYLAVVL